jgi:hypothetical protein
MRIAVFCSSSPTIDAKYQAVATQLGNAIGNQGWGLVSGGGHISTMGAIGRAVREVGGHTIGVIPQSLVDIEFANKTKIEKKKAKNLYAFFLENTLVLHKKEFDCRELFFSATNANKIEFTLRVNFWTNIRFSINVKKGFVLTI